MRKNEYKVIFVGNSQEPAHGTKGTAGFDPYWECYIFMPDNSEFAYMVPENELIFL